ncbi:MAG: hypothetical protein Q8L69_15180 [Gallionellaceae bacterium]|nr:hypothetical protein [Gallionellaceae bacterium]
MRNRLTAFVVALLLLPPLALSLAGQEWQPPAPLAGSAWLPALAATGFVILFCILLDMLTFRRTGHSLWRSQRSYLLWCGVAGAIMGMLLAWLNLFADSWITPSASESASLLFATLCATSLLPAVLITRLWLAGLLKLGTRRFALPALPAEPAAKSLLFAALIGLMLGPIHIHELGWLFWLSPLLLLVALQLLWHESNVFSGLAQGDWSRLLLGSLSGILVCGIALATYRASGGTVYLASNIWQQLYSFALFGLLCLQIGDIVAEHWRGKPRGEVFKKKAFPIPVVSRKDQ